MIRFCSSALTAAAVLSTCVFLAACSSRSVVPLPQEPTFYRNLSTPGTEVDAQAAAEMISGFRANNGLGPVVIDPALNRLAKEQSVAMARAKTVNHTLAGTLDSRAKARGYQYTRIAENIAGGYQTLAEAFSGWRESSGHRKNMLMPTATRMGIAVEQAPGFKYKVFRTMIVAQPYTPPVASAGPGAAGFFASGPITIR